LGKEWPDVWRGFQVSGCFFDVFDRKWAFLERYSLDFCQNSIKMIKKEKILDYFDQTVLQYKPKESKTNQNSSKCSREREVCNMKKRIALTLALALTLSLTACSGGGTQEEQAPAEAPAESGSEEAEAPAETPAEKEKLVIGFANIAEEVELQIQVRESMVKAAEEAGVELILANNEYDGAKAVEIADNMVSQGIDGFIEFNIDESVGPVIMEKMEAAGIPVIAVDIPIEGAVFFGANNETAGTVGGQRLGEVAKERWGEAPDCLLLVEDSTSGEAVLARTEKMYDGLKETFPDFSEDQIFRVDPTTDAAKTQSMVSDFLSAHPDYHKIAIGTLNDVIATATLAAIETAGREADCIMVAENEYGYLDYLKANPDVTGDEVWVGGVAFFFNRYGEYTVPAVIKMINGEEVDEKIYVDHLTITRDNAEEWFADYLAS
jgi:ribose transport system substrate-binding protein